MISLFMYGSIIFIFAAWCFTVWCYTDAMVTGKRQKRQDRVIKDSLLTLAKQGKEEEAIAKKMIDVLIAKNSSKKSKKISKIKKARIYQHLIDESIKGLEEIDARFNEDDQMELKKINNAVDDSLESNTILLHELSLNKLDEREIMLTPADTRHS